MAPPQDPSTGPSTRLSPLSRKSGAAAGVRLLAVTGPDRGRGVDLAPGQWTLGTDAACAFVLTDPLISRRHVAISISNDELRLADLDSTNGSYFQGARFASLEVTPGAVFRLGDTEIKILSPQEAGPGAPTLSGRLACASPRMQAVLADLEIVAATDITLLLEGEAGAGKKVVAEAVHAASARAGAPFVVCDVGEPASAALVEVELFGCVRGAVPGIDEDKEGAFARADGGTLLLDHIGELPSGAQRALLRAIERRLIRPVGAASARSVNVRVFATASPDIHADVEAGRFRSDLYHRLAAMRIELPPLRERREDLPLLVTQIIAEASEGRAPPAVADDVMAALADHDWPGNIRQLRGVLERAVALSGSAPVLDAAVLGLRLPVPGPGTIKDPATGRIVPFREARERLVDTWEREYVLALLERTKGNVSLAARRAGITRVYLHQIIRKHNLERG